MRPAIRNELPVVGLSKPHEKDIFGISAEGFELSKKNICLFCTISDKT